MDIIPNALPNLPIELSRRFDPRVWEQVRGRFIPLWWPCTIRVLMVGDFISGFGKGSDYHLGRVIEALRLNLPHFISLDIKTAYHHSSAGNGADINALNFAQHDLNQYDQIWFFAVGGGNSAYQAGELGAIWAFMQAGGGVFATGDHADLGVALCGSIPRVRSMRRWFWPNQGPNGEPSAPGSGIDGNNTTIGNDFDGSPQTIRPRMYAAGIQFVWRQSTRPHPVLCGPKGPITVLPDHMHEGVCEVPSNLNASLGVEGSMVEEYPRVSGTRLAPEVIATGYDHNDSQDFGQIAVYDGHIVDEVNNGVGRIVVDATWHHFFDMNVNQFAEAFDIVQQNIAAGIVPTAQNLQLADHWTQIAAYFRNIAIWLARKNTQQCIVNRGIWFIRWHSDLRMAFFANLDIHPDPLGYFLDLGNKAYDVFSQVAPQCLIQQIIFDLIEPFERPVYFDPWDFRNKRNKKEKPRLPFAEFDTLAKIALGGALHELLKIKKLDEKEIGGEGFRKTVADASGVALQLYAKRMREDADSLGRYLARRK